MLHSVTDVSKENTRNWSSRPYILTFLRPSIQQFDSNASYFHFFPGFENFHFLFLFSSFSATTRRIKGNDLGNKNSQRNQAVKENLQKAKPESNAYWHGNWRVQHQKLLFLFLFYCLVWGNRIVWKAGKGGEMILREVE